MYVKISRLRRKNSNDKSQYKDFHGMLGSPIHAGGILNPTTQTPAVKISRPRRRNSKPHNAYHCCNFTKSYDVLLWRQKLKVFASGFNAFQLANVLWCTTILYYGHRYVKCFLFWVACHDVIISFLSRQRLPICWFNVTITTEIYAFNRDLWVFFTSSKLTCYAVLLLFCCIIMSAKIYCMPLA